MILNRFIICVAILFTLLACNKLKGPKKPENLISKNKMVAVLIDAKLLTSANSANKLVMRDSGVNLDTFIYDKHNIDSLQFALSNSYYAFHVDDYEEIYSLVTDSLEKLKASLKEKEAQEWKAQTKREQDSLDQVLKQQQLQKPLKNLDSLRAIIKKDSLQIEDVLLEESINEIENLIEPITD
jgi:hypothetical protein